MKSSIASCFIPLFLLSAVTAFDSEASALKTSSSTVKKIPAMAYVEANQVYNPESVIPPQCYTKTEQKFNPCYVCHQSYDLEEKRVNAMHDGGLQGAYAFSELGEINHWQNLFEERQERINDIDNERIKRYIEQDNFTPFIETLAASDFKGVVPSLDKLAYPDKAFGEYGIAKDGSHWVAFNYKPFPSTFWPTNGSTGDVMIRLGKSFREKDGRYSFDIYFVNLTLVEMAIKDKDMLSVPPISETVVGVDLDGDGRISDQIQQIKRRTHFVGDAEKIQLTPSLYPQGTEILHTVRYIGINDKGEVFNAPRMKEVRYMQKHMLKTPQELMSSYYHEKKEKNDEVLPKTAFHGDRGISNGFGWTINGFIENKNGQLRQQNHQELSFCNGCHKSIGTTIDQTFSFPRKVDGLAGWGYIDLKKIKDVPNIDETRGEFLTYMERVGGGDEFRQNKEMLSRWFDVDGKLNKKAVLSVPSIFELITPSPERAMELNKAYYLIVQEQSFIYGRDATVKKAINVHSQVNESQAPLLPEHIHAWDMRLSW